MRTKLSIISLCLGSLLYLPPVLSAPAPAFHQCTKVFTYDLFLSNQKIGYLTRTLRWQDNFVNIDTYSKVKIMVAKARFRQNSKVIWSEKQNSFLTRTFTRKISGLMSGKTSASFSKDGSESILNHNGVVAAFTSKDLPLLDSDAVGSQIRLNLIEGKKKFDFKLQDTDEINHYHFEVKRKEKIDTNFGRLPAIRVEQVYKSDRKLVMWFAPDVDYQVVKATYHRKLLSLKTQMKHKNIQCPQASTHLTAANQ